MHPVRSTPFFEQSAKHSTMSNNNNINNHNNNNNNNNNNNHIPTHSNTKSAPTTPIHSNFTGNDDIQNNNNNNNSNSNRNSPSLPFKNRPGHLSNENRSESFKASFRAFQLLSAKKYEFQESTRQSNNGQERSRLSLRFKQTKVERDFCQFYAKESAKKLRLSIALVFLVELLSSAFDFLFLHRNGIELTGGNDYGWIIPALRYLVCIIFGILGLIAILWKR